MNKITPEQLKCLNTLVSKQGISKDDKEALVQAFSGGRASSSKDLLFGEAAVMIRHLKEFDPNDKMRKKVFALAYEASIIYDDSPDDKRINPAKLDMFLLRTGTVKKKLISMNKEELIKTVNQFQQILKHTEESQSSKVTTSLLNELHIPTISSRPGRKP